MRKLFILLILVEIIAIVIILNYYPDSIYITPTFYTLLGSVVILLLILTITYFGEYTILRKIHAKIKYYGFIYEKNGAEYLIFKDMKTHKSIYNREIDYVNPNLIESLIIQEQPIIPMNNYIQFVSEDFKLKVPKDCKDIPEFIINLVNQSNPRTQYILDDYGRDWIRLIDMQNPQSTMTFRRDTTS